jgi:hypothetical protein
MIPVGFTSRTDLVVIGTHPEMANYDNPRGEIYGFASYVVAEAADGERRCLAIKVSACAEEALAPAERQAAALNARLKAGKLPVAFNAWHHDRPAYGSDAYCSPDNLYEELAWERELDQRF